MTLEGTGSNAAGEPNTREQPSSDVKSRLGSDRRVAADSIVQEMLEEELYDPGSATNANTTMRNTRHPSGLVTGNFPPLRPVPSHHST